MNTHASNYQRRQGFTLLELLTVVVVISILAAITFASITKMRSSADEARCVSNLRSLAVAGLAYANDNQSTMPDVILWRNRDPRSDATKRYSLIPYLYGHKEPDPAIEYTSQGVLACPLTKNDSRYSVKDAADTATYAINVYAHGTNVNKSGMGNYEWWLINNDLTGNLHSFHTPSEMPFFMDGPGITDDYGTRYSTFQEPKRIPPATEALGGGAWRTPYLHRDNRIAVVFLDGHVSQVDYEWLSQEKNWIGN